MDKPVGPRQPPDKRNAAYESIFGRPGVAHHQGATPANYPQALYHPPPNQPYPYPPQQYQSNADRRTSYSSFTPSVHSHSGYHVPQSQAPPGAYRQSYYPSYQSQALPPTAYPPPIPGAYGYSPGLAPPNSVPSRARSVTSNPQSPGIIVPQPEEPPDRSLEAFTQSGLTPAQAYQAQVYLNSPAGPQGDWSRYRTSPAPSDWDSFPQTQDGSPSRYQDAPMLGVTLEHDDGRLGIDFAGNSGNSSDPGTDEGSSELPWARKEYPG